MVLLYILILTALTPVVTGISPRCYDQRERSIDCDGRLQDVLDENLAAFDIIFNKTTMTSEEDIRLLNEQSAIILCDPANLNSVSCILDNTAVCRSEFQVDEELRETFFASSLVRYYPVRQTTSSVCDHYKAIYCVYREDEFDDCYTTLANNTQIIDPQSTDVCASASNFDSLTCMINKYNDCRQFFSLTVLNSNLKQDISRHNWHTFTSGFALCECYEGHACYAQIQEQIASRVVSSTTLRNIYRNAVSKVEVLCSYTTALTCSLRARGRECESILDDYDTTVIKMNTYKASVDVMCNVVKTAEFRENTECIVDRFANTFHPCLADSDLLRYEIDSCRLVQKLYNCVKYAFPDRQCNGNYVDVAYEIIRVKYGTLDVCQVSTAMTTAPSLALITTFVLLIFVCVKYFVA